MSPKARLFTNLYHVLVRNSSVARYSKIYVPNVLGHQKEENQAPSSPTSSSFCPPTARRILCLHALLNVETQVEAFTSAGFLHRKGLQYHWRNKDRKIDDSGSVNNKKKSSNSNTNNGNSINKNNNGADAPTATVSTVVVGVTTTPASPSGAAEQAATTASAVEGEENANKKYADFDSYLGNFASKRRIKACVFSSNCCCTFAELRSIFTETECIHI